MKTKLKACLLCLLVPVLLQGQEIGVLRMNLDTVGFKGSAAIRGGVEEGGFRPIHAASFQWTAGAEAKVVNHGEHSSWTGALSFDQMMGQYKNGNGYSMLLEPDYFPLDIVEFSPGTKSRQSFSLEGGFLTDFGYDWAAGVKASVQGAYTSKRREIPHKDLALTVQLEPTLTFVMDDDMGLVSTYIARFRTENLKADVAGTDGNMPFMDMGLRYGAYLPGGNAYLENGAFQIQEFTHGVSELLYNPELTLGLEMLWKRGKAGNGRLNYPGSTISAFYEQTIQEEIADHVFHVSYQRERDQLKETRSESVIPVSDRVGRSLNLKYEARFLEGVFRSVGISLDGDRWSERSTIIPNFQDKVVRYGGAATLLSSFSFGIVDLDLNASAARGWWKDRGRVAGQDDAVDIEFVGDYIRRADDWRRKTDYLTAPRIGLGGTLTCRIPPVKGMYVQLCGGWHRALKVKYLPGKNREIGKLTIGYNF
jgi:hypothetical protein